MILALENVQHLHFFSYNPKQFHTPVAASGVLSFVKSKIDNSTISILKNIDIIKQPKNNQKITWPNRSHYNIVTRIRLCKSALRHYHYIQATDQKCPHCKTNQTAPTSLSPLQKMFFTWYQRTSNLISIYQSTSNKHSMVTGYNT